MSGSHRRGPFAVAEGAVSVILDVGDPVVIHLSVEHGAVEPIDDVLVIVQPAQVLQVNQRVELILEHPADWQGWIFKSLNQRLDRPKE